jgi:hypothetical protein
VTEVDIVETTSRTVRNGCVNTSTPLIPRQQGTLRHGLMRRGDDWSGHVPNVVTIVGLLITGKLAEIRG